MAKDKKPAQPKSEQEVLDEMLQMYEMILHPNFLNTFRIQMTKAYLELKEEAKAFAMKEYNISEEAIVIDKEIKKMRANIAGRDPDNLYGLRTLYTKSAYKQVLKILFGNETKKQSNESS